MGKKILGSNRRWKHVQTSTEKLLMEDNPIARMSNKDLWSSYSLLCNGYTTDLLRTGPKLKFHQDGTTFKFKTGILQILLQIPIYPEVFNTISISDLNARSSPSTTPKTGGLHIQIMRIPNRDEEPSSPFHHWSFAAEVHGHRPHPGVPNAPHIQELNVPTSELGSLQKKKK